jgi:hypothetical protein
MIVATGSGNLQFVALYVQVSSACLSPRWIGSLCLCCVVYLRQQNCPSFDIRQAYFNIRILKTVKLYLLHISDLTTGPATDCENL